MSLEPGTKQQFLTVESLEEPEKEELRNLILANDIDFRENGEEFEAIIRIKNFPNQVDRNKQRAEFRQTFTDKLMINKVYNLVVKEKELLKELRDRRLSNFNKLKLQASDQRDPKKRVRQSIMFKKSVTIEESGKNDEQDVIETTGNRRESKNAKERKMRYSIVKSEELAEIFKTKNVAQETEKLIQKEKEKERERINGFSEWVARKRAVSDRQRAHKESFFNFGKKNDSLNSEKKKRSGLNNDEGELKMDRLQDLEEIVQVLPLNIPKENNEEIGSPNEEPTKRPSEGMVKPEAAARSSLQDIQEFQKLLNRIVEGDLNEEEENYVHDNCKNEKINQELRDIENIQNEIKSVSYDLDKLNRIFDLPRLFKEEEDKNERKIRTEEKKSNKKYRALGASADKANQSDDTKFENMFRRSFLNQVKHWEIINIKDQGLIQQQYKRTLKEMQNNLKKLNTAELVNYYKFLVDKARTLFNKYMREHALASQI